MKKIAKKMLCFTLVTSLSFIASNIPVLGNDGPNKGKQNLGKKMEKLSQKIILKDLNVVGIYVENLDDALKFYVDLLGMKKTRKLGQGWLLLADNLVSGNLSLYVEGGRKKSQGDPLNQSCMSLCFSTKEGIKNTYARLVKAKVNMVGKYMAHSNEFHSFSCLDPSGNVLEFSGNPAAVSVGKRDDSRNLSPINELMLPAKNIAETRKFLANFGYKLINEQPWGMVQLKSDSGGPSISLFSQDFFKTTSFGIKTTCIDELFEELQKKGVKITEDDRKSDPPRIVCAGPDNFEITIFQEKK